MKPALLIALIIPVTAATAMPRPADTPSHGYVLGRFADADDRLGDAARYYDAARRLDPGDVTLLRRTFESALAAGDQKLAIDLAKQLATAGPDSTVALVRLADALNRRDWKTADAARPGLADAGYAAVVGPIVEGWTLYGRGKTDAALAVLEPEKFTGFARSYVIEHRALVMSAARRWDDANPLFAALLAAEARSVTQPRISAAAALQASKDDAAADAMLAAGGPSPVLDAARARLKVKKPVGPTALEPRQGVARLVSRLAGDLAREQPVPLALVFARVATFLEPNMPESWVVAADVLARSGRTEAALDALARIDPDAPIAPAVRARRALLLSEEGRDTEAREMLEAATAASTAATEDWVRLGDFDRKLLKHADAARAYDRAVASLGATPGKSDWTLYFLRGSAYEQSGDWARAEPDLRVALGLAPQEPAVLNYLGYALLDRGLKLPEAQTLIEAASRLQPDDGFITDSLGWAYFRTAQYDKAIPVLERAVAAEPGDPTINEHLGDAYWRGGRRMEARFRWKAAIDLGAVPAQAATIRSKLDFGLDVALAQATAAPARP